MADWLKKMKGVFVVPETQSNTSSASTPVRNNTPTPAPTSTPVYNAPVNTSPGAPDAKFSSMLLDILRQNNRPGFDYLEFRESLQSLSAMPMQEAIRYQSALAVAKTMGVDANFLLQSAKGYLDLLAAEEQRFQESAQRQRSQQVNVRAEQIQGLQANIAQKEQQVAQLNQEIAQHRAQLQQLEQETQGADAKINITISNFHASYLALRSEIELDIQKMKTHLA